MSVTIPDGMPILGCSSHDDPREGACFMEYTSLLAGEQFTDTPICVDESLCYIMQSFNDRLSDVQRQVLVPFLGRGIGLAISPKKPWKEILAEHKNPVTSTRILEAQNTFMAQNREAFAQRERLRRKVIDKVARKLRIRKTEDVACEHGRQVRMRISTDNPHGLADWYMRAYRAWFEEHEGDLDFETKLAAEVTRRVEIIHVAYEEALAEMGYTKPTEVACDLSSVMELVGKR